MATPPHWNGSIRINRISRTSLERLERSLSPTSTETTPPSGQSLLHSRFVECGLDDDYRYIEYPARADADEAIRTLSTTLLKGVSVTVEDAVRHRSLLVLSAALTKRYDSPREPEWIKETTEEEIEEAIEVTDEILEIPVETATDATIETLTDETTTEILETTDEITADETTTLPPDEDPSVLDDETIGIDDLLLLFEILESDLLLESERDPRLLSLENGNPFEPLFVKFNVLLKSFPVVIISVAL